MHEPKGKGRSLHPGPFACYRVLNPAACFVLACWALNLGPKPLAYVAAEASTCLGFACRHLPRIEPAGIGQLHALNFCLGAGTLASFLLLCRPARLQSNRPQQPDKHPSTSSKQSDLLLPACLLSPLWAVLPSRAIHAPCQNVQHTVAQNKHCPADRCSQLTS